MIALNVGWENKYPVSKQVVQDILVTQTQKVTGVIPWAIFIDLIAQSVKVLLEGCPNPAPTPTPTPTPPSPARTHTPEEAVEFLAWRPLPVFDWFGWRLQRHRDTIRLAIARNWQGNYSDLRGVQDRIFTAIDSGKVTVPMMRSLFAEHSG